MTPQVSIIFTSYNHKEFLEQALNSLLNQTFKDFELIIVDDCSTDGSQDVLKSYNDPRIRLFLNEKNSGSYVKSSNYGASKAVAPYMLFAQCDDWAEPTQLETLMNHMLTHNVGVVYSCSNMVDEGGHLLGTDFDCRIQSFKSLCSSDTIIGKKDAMFFLLDSCIIPNLSAALIKKSFYDQLGGLSDNYLVLADWDFWLRMSLITDFYYIREPLNNFRQHSTTIRSTIKMKRQLEELFNMFFMIEKAAGLSKQIVCSYLTTLWLRWRGEGVKQWLILCPHFMLLGTKFSWHFPISIFKKFLISNGSTNGTK